MNAIGVLRLVAGEGGSDPATQAARARRRQKGRSLPPSPADFFGGMARQKTPRVLIESRGFRDEPRDMTMRVSSPVQRAERARNSADSCDFSVGSDERIIVRQVINLNGWDR